MSTGLFHGAIAESGTAAIDAILTLDPLLMAKVISPPQLMALVLCVLDFKVMHVCRTYTNML